MASQANAQMWDELRAYAMGGDAGRITDAKVRQRMRLASMAQARASAEGAQLNVDILRQREADRQADRQARLDAQTAAQESRASQTEQRTAERAAMQARVQRTRATRGVTRFIQNITPQRAQDAGARLRSLPTPGGLGGVIAALVFFNLAVVPVGAQGETRLYLIWQAITGAMTLPTNVQVGISGAATTPGAGGPVSQTVTSGLASATGQSPSTVVSESTGIGQALNAIAAGNPLLDPLIYGAGATANYLRGLGTVGSYLP